MLHIRIAPNNRWSTVRRGNRKDLYRTIYNFDYNYFVYPPRHDYCAFIFYTFIIFYYNYIENDYKCGYLQYLTALELHGTTDHVLSFTSDILDTWTNKHNTNYDGIIDGDEDRDKDGIVDADESDPRSVDTDGDGLSDSEEDKNKNGICDQGETKAYDVDTDGDSLWDGYNITVNGIEYWGELTLGTDPLDTDTDNDKLKDDEEVLTYKTSPLTNDTDMDGLDDYTECISGLTFTQNYYKVGGAHVTTSKSVSASDLDPLNPDVDSDGLTDGQEVNGWTVMVAYESTGEMKTKEYVFKTDPTTHNYDLNLDSDGDGISDKVEVEMSKLCDYYRDVSGWINADSYHQTLYEKYKWFIENRVKSAKDWAEWNDTIRSQFSPFVKESIPPIITGLECDFEYDTTWYGVSFEVPWWLGGGTVSIGLTIIEAIWLKTTVSIFDAGDVDKLDIKLSTSVYIPSISWEGITYTQLVANIGSETYTNIGSGLHTFEFIKSVDGITWALGQTIGFDAEVSVKDAAGKITTVTFHRDGLIDKIWDFLTEIWNQIVGAITAAVKAVVEVLNKIVDWVIEKIKSLLEAALQPVWDAYNTWIDGNIRRSRGL